MSKQTQRLKKTQEIPQNRGYWKKLIHMQMLSQQRE